MADRRKRTGADAAPPALREDEAGAVQIGPTDQGMVRIILTTQAGIFELDFPPDEAREIADELTAAADIADGGGSGGVRPRKSR